MPTTSKMGIVYPSSSDLVKDGATDMGTIATTVDAKTGLILLNTTSFSAVASQSFNDVFSTNYTHYKIVGNMVASTSASAYFRFRVSGADNTTTNYGFQYLKAYSTTVEAARSTSQNYCNIATVNSTNYNFFSIELANPFDAVMKTGITSNASGAAAATEVGLYTIGFSATTSFTGFSIIASTGTFTGSVSVYGFNK